MPAQEGTRYRLVFWDGAGAQSRDIFFNQFRDALIGVAPHIIEGRGHAIVEECNPGENSGKCIAIFDAVGLPSE